MSDAPLAADPLRSGRGIFELQSFASIRSPMPKATMGARLEPISSPRESPRAPNRDDGHQIHANVDTDVMLSEEPPYGAMDKPSELYAIIEHFCNGRRRLELFGEDTNIRRGWLTLGSSLSSSNHDAKTWHENFEGTIESYNFDDDVPQVLPNHLVGTTPLIESLRPKSPTQLREEAQRRQTRDYERAQEQQRKEIEAMRAFHSLAMLIAFGVARKPSTPVLNQAPQREPT